VPPRPLLLLVLSELCAALLPGAPALASETSRPEVRALWGERRPGAVLRIEGLGFGMHTLRVSSSVGPEGWIETNPARTPIDSLDGATGWASFNCDFPPFIDDRRAHSGRHSVNASIDMTRDGDFGKSMYYRSEHRFEKIYATWWVYFDPMVTGDAAQWKIWRVGDRTDHFMLNDNCAGVYQWSEWRDKVPHDYQTTFGCMLDCGPPGSVPCYENVVPEPYYPAPNDNPLNYAYHTRGATEPITANITTPGIWCRTEFFLQASDLDRPNGKYWLAIHKPGQPRKLIDNWIDGLLTRSSDCCRDDSDPWENFVLQGFFSEWGGTTRLIADMLYDDIYIQLGTEARVELGDARNYENCTTLEIQTPISWTDREIQIELNRGSLDPTSKPWLFVIDEHGKVSEGWSTRFESEE